MSSTVTVTGSPVTQTREINSKWKQLIYITLREMISDRKRLTIAIILILLAVTLIISLIQLVNAFSKYDDSWETMATTSTAAPKRENGHVLIIRTIDDIYQIDSMVIVVRVEPVEPKSDLLESIPPPTNSKLQNQTSSVKELVITEQLSEQWVMFFMITFRGIENLTMDIDQLCMGSLDLEPAELSRKLLIVNVKSFVMTNDTICNMSTWIYKWRFPFLQNLYLNHGIISISSFVGLEGFLRNYSKAQGQSTAGKGLTLTHSLCFGGGISFKHELVRIRSDVKKIEEISAHQLTSLN